MPVSVIFGADEEQFDSISGMEFNSVIDIVRRAMTIPDEITDVRLNGQEAPLGTKIVKDGDTISFYKRSGQKGC